MVFDALRGYAQLANGLTDVTKQRAVQAARQLVDAGGGLIVGVTSSAGSAEIARQVQGLAEDLIATSRTNRDLLVGLIRTEVERAVGRLGLVGADELSAMARVVERLQNQLDAAIAFGGRVTGEAAGSPAADEEAGSSGRRKVRREPVTFAAPPRSATKPAPAKKTAKKTARKTAKKTTAKKSVAKTTMKAAPKAAATPPGPPVTQPPGDTGDAGGTLPVHPTEAVGQVQGTETSTGAPPADAGTSLDREQP